MADTHDEGSGSDDVLPDEDAFLQSESTFAATSFDQYFLLASKSSRTSSNVFSARVDPLTPQEFTAALSSLPSLAEAPPIDYRSAFPKFLLQLEQGFNLLFYGAGSKRDVLNSFVEYIHRRRKVHVVVANAFNPNFTIKDLLNSIENVLDTSSAPSTQRGVEGQFNRIHHVLNHTETSPRLCILIHNIDSPSLLSTKAKAMLSNLASDPNVHLLASVDNIAFPLLWSLGESSGRKQSSGYAWLYHDLTTLRPYDFELSYADRSSISGASRTNTRAARARAADGGIPAVMTEVAARHILLSVTEKAKKLFVLLATRQIESMAEGASAQDVQETAVEYGTLFTIARDNFVATNDTAFRALMGEFKDHGLMLTAPQGPASGDVVWIPLRKTVLSTLMADLQQGQL
ncbi:unnamed protein product [Somion occarium]|uniref:Origin recognition complex subunit 2 n=1 Tax=Somion occarium TaxID=3059160 RepID=A0ABP1E1H9_9APHY